MKKDSFFSISLTVVLLLLIGSVGPVIADDRTWVKRTLDGVNDRGDSVFRVVQITTMDGIAPTKARFLYKDNSSGELLVIRYEINSETETHSFSYKSLSTGEILSFNLTPPSDPEESHTVVLEIGEDSLTFLDDDRKTDGVRQQAAALGISTEFNTILRDFTDAAVNIGAVVAGPGLALQEIFFYDIELPPQPYTGEEIVGSVTNFDPNTTPPNAFEQLFGDAYYE